MKRRLYVKMRPPPSQANKKSRALNKLKRTCLTIIVVIICIVIMITFENKALSGYMDTDAAMSAALKVAGNEPVGNSEPYPFPPMISHQHAIVVPYRDREFHLKIFKDHMKNYLSTYFPEHKFDIWIIEQADDELFNRGWLMNVGLTELSKVQDSGCVVLHDVDMVPQPGVPYTQCDWPIQLGSEMEHRNWTVRYEQYCGGVVSMRLEHWKQINGASNDYVGWGLEDDDLRERLRRQKGFVIACSHVRHRPEDSRLLTPHQVCIRRPPLGHGRFNSLARNRIYHGKKKLGDINVSKDMINEMYKGSDRWQHDGLNDLRYHILERDDVTDGVHHLKVVPDLK